MEVQVPDHKHPLRLVDLQLESQQYEEENEEDEDGLILKQDFRCSCNLCIKEIYRFHRYYYKCTHSCTIRFTNFVQSFPQ